MTSYYDPEWRIYVDRETGQNLGTEKPWDYGLEVNSPEWASKLFERQHGYAANATPTTIKMARELGYFGPNLRSESFDPIIKSIFDARGLNEQQAVDATLKGLKEHERQYGQGYTTASSIADIFNGLILPAAGKEGIAQLNSIPGWSAADAEARGNRARAVEHGGDFGSATGLGQILSFQSNLGGNIVEAWKNDPERMLLGINTPLESTVWGAALGKDYDPTVDMFGGATKKDSQTAAEKGIDTQSGEAMHTIARMIVGGQAGAAGYGKAVSGANAANGALSNGNLSSDSLIAGIPALASMGASYFGNGLTTGDGVDSGSLIGDAGNDTLGANMGEDGWYFDDFSGEWVPPSSSGFDMTRLSDPSYWNPQGGTTGLADPGASGLDMGTSTYGGESTISGYLSKAQELAKQLGITPALALQAILKATARAAPAALGAVGANQQRQSLEGLAKQYMDLGAPSRARYEASYAPGFTLMNDPGYKDALDATAKATLHGLSVNGNPAGSPNAWSQSLSDLYAKTAYPALQHFRNQNASTGGIASFSAAAPGAATGAIGAQGNVYNAIGAGMNDIFNPPQSIAQTLAEYQRLLKSQGSGAVT